MGLVRLSELLALQSEAPKREHAELQRELRSHMPHVSAKYRITEEAYAEKQAELKFGYNLCKNVRGIEGNLSVH
jgi:hypothetical protein